MYMYMYLWIIFAMGIIARNLPFVILLGLVQRCKIKSSHEFYWCVHKNNVIEFLI